MDKTLSIDQFADLIAGITGTDRYNLIVTSGDMGEGKSCLTAQLARAVAKRSDTTFSLRHNMTYLRKELQQWIDGEGEEKKGQLPERSVVLADELISLFFKRNWYQESQIEGVELLNKCRDRHLSVIGNIPNFWDLDSGIMPHIRFWIHVVQRGEAWVFEKDANPFTVDKWNRRENEKTLGKDKVPYKSRNFLFTITWNDWSDEERQEYYEIRNEKRVGTEGQGKVDKERVRKLHWQVKMLTSYITQKGLLGPEMIGNLIDCSPRNVAELAVIPIPHEILVATRKGTKYLGLDDKPNEGHSA